MGGRGETTATPVALGAIVAGRYQVDAPLGGGGYARVYRAHHVELGTPVALKLLAAPYAESAEHRARLLREARAAAALTHPHIVRVFDLGELEDGALFVAMEYIEGRTLGEYLEDGPMSPDAVADIAAQIASALDHAHARGIIHRDLKPSNVVLCETADHPFAKLIDFGIVKRVGLRMHGEQARGETTSLTAEHLVVGTPAYMAPEQVCRDPLGPPTDQYALGIVVWQMLTGRRPFEDPDPVRLMLARLDRPPPDLPPGPHGPWPAAVDACLRRALARYPTDRFESTGAFAAALGAALRQTAPRDPAPRPRDEPTVVVAFPPESGPRPAAQGPGLLAATSDRAAPTQAVPEAPTALHSTSGRIVVGNGASEGEDRDTSAIVSTFRPRRPAALPWLLAAILLAAGAGMAWHLLSTSQHPSTLATHRAGAVRPAAPTVRAGAQRPTPRRVEAARSVLPPRREDAAAALRAARHPLEVRASVPRRRQEPVGNTQPARLSVTVVPVGEVFVDGRSYGDLGIAGLAIRPGRHRLRVVARDGRSWSWTLRLRPGRHLVVQVDAARGTRQVSVRRAQ